MNCLSQSVKPSPFEKGSVVYIVNKHENNNKILGAFG